MSDFLNDIEEKRGKSLDILLTIVYDCVVISIGQGCGIKLTFCCVKYVVERWFLYCCSCSRSHLNNSLQSFPVTQNTSRRTGELVCGIIQLVELNLIYQLYPGFTENTNNFIKKGGTFGRRAQKTAKAAGCCRRLVERVEHNLPQRDVPLTHPVIETNLPHSSASMGYRTIVQNGGAAENRQGCTISLKHLPDWYLHVAIGIFLSSVWQC